MKMFKNFKVLNLVRQFPKYFEFSSKPIFYTFYLFKRYVKILGIFNDYFEGYIQITKSI